MKSQKNFKTQLTESPDRLHYSLKSQDGFGFNEGDITFIYVPGCLLWGNTVLETGGRWNVVHSNIANAIMFTVVDYYRQRYPLKQCLSYLKNYLKKQNISYYGSLHRAIKAFDTYEKNRNKHMYGRLFPSNHAFSIWNWKEEEIIKKSETLYKIFKILGVSKPETLLWDFSDDPYSDEEKNIQKQIGKPIGEVQLVDMMVYNKQNINPTTNKSTTTDTNKKKSGHKKVTNDINISKEEFHRLEKELADIQNDLHQTPPGPQKETAKKRMIYILSILRNVSVDDIKDTQPKSRWKYGIPPWKADAVRGIAEDIIRHSKKNSKTQLTESPDYLHDVFGQDFFTKEDITFLYIPGCLFWGNTKGENNHFKVVHPTIVNTIKPYANKLQHNPKAQHLREFKNALRNRDIKYRGSLSRALVEYSKSGEDRNVHMYGRLFPRVNAFSIWNWDDKKIINHADTLYKIFEVIGVRNPENLFWDFDPYRLGYTGLSPAKDVIQPQIQKEIGKVTLNDMMKYNVKHSDSKSTANRHIGSDRKATADINISKEESARLKKELADLQREIHTTPPGPQKEGVRIRMAQILNMLRGVSASDVRDIKPKSRWKYGIPPWKADAVRGIAEASLNHNKPAKIGITEDPDNPHSVFGSERFTPQDTTFLYMPGCLFWGLTLSNDTRKHFGVIHSTITDELEAATKYMEKLKNFKKTLTLLKQYLKDRKISYLGSLKSAITEYKLRGENRSKHIYGRLYPNHNVFSIWDWKDSDVLDKADILYKIFKIMGVPNPKELLWDFDIRALGYSRSKPAETIIQPQIKKQLGQVTLDDMLKYKSENSSEPSNVTNKNEKHKATGDININKEEFAKLKKELEYLRRSIHSTPPGPQKETVKNRMYYLLSILQGVSVDDIKDNIPKARWKYGIPPWKADAVRGIAEENSNTSLYRELLSIIDSDFEIPHKKTISEQIKECVDTSTVKYRSTSLKDFLEDNY